MDTPKPRFGAFGPELGQLAEGIYNDSATLGMQTRQRRRELLARTAELWLRMVLDEWAQDDPEYEFRLWVKENDIARHGRTEVMLVRALLQTPDDPVPPTTAQLWADVIEYGQEWLLQKHQGLPPTDGWQGLLMHMDAVGSLDAISKAFRGDAQADKPGPKSPMAKLRAELAAAKRQLAELPDEANGSVAELASMWREAQVKIKYLEEERDDLKKQLAAANAEMAEFERQVYETVLPGARVTIKEDATP